VRIAEEAKAGEVWRLDEYCRCGHASVPDGPNARPGYSIARKRARVQISHVGVWCGRHATRMWWTQGPMWIALWKGFAPLVPPRKIIPFKRMRRESAAVIVGGVDGGDNRRAWPCGSRQSGLPCALTPAHNAVTTGVGCGERWQCRGITLAWMWTYVDKRGLPSTVSTLCPQSRPRRRWRAISPSTMYPAPSTGLSTARVDAPRHLSTRLIHNPPHLSTGLSTGMEGDGTVASPAR